MTIATLTGKSRIAGVFGWPVDHSRSPRLHGYWLREFNIDGAYIPFATHPSRLEQGIRALPALGFRGGNVTLPHKERALGLVDEATPLARRIGAVNTLVVREDGTILGDNTDGFGFIGNLRQFEPAWRGAAGPAVVLGAGGAARAAVFGLLERGARVRVLNRTRARADRLAAELGAAGSGALEDLGKVACDVLVNTTSVGLREDASPVAAEAIAAGSVVLDAVYDPPRTRLLRDAAARGARAIEGKWWLVHQAAEQLAAWTGRAAPLEVMAAAFDRGSSEAPAPA
jgi:shikimate dehydrogenase